jgi:hypothetical protein
MPGVRLNVSRRGLGVSAGPRGLTVSRGADGRYRRTLSVPGTGLDNTEVIFPRKKRHMTAPQGPSVSATEFESPSGRPKALGWLRSHPKTSVAGGLLLLGLLGSAGGGSGGDNATTASVVSVSDVAADEQQKAAEKAADETAAEKAAADDLAAETAAKAAEEAAAAHWRARRPQAETVRAVHEGRQQCPAGEPIGGSRPESR